MQPNNDGTYANGNVYGASKGLADTWWCEKAIVFATNVNVSGSTVMMVTVYGGGQVGRVENDAKVTIGTKHLRDGKPHIKGNVFRCRCRLKTHGYSALVRGNAEVTVQGIAQVGGSVYGGGEIASVGKFTVVKGLPTKPETGGTCTVNIKDNAKNRNEWHGRTMSLVPARVLHLHTILLVKIIRMSRVCRSKKTAQKAYGNR